MAYSKTNWVNDTTPINADHLNNIENGIETLDNEIGNLNDLETQNTNTIVNALNGLATGEIVGSNLNADNGYIKYSNGIMLEWKSLSGTAGGNVWGNAYYSDHQMGSWAISFTSLFFTIPTSSSALYDLASDAGTNTDAGMIRATRPNEGTASVKFKIIGIGLWK